MRLKRLQTRFPSFLLPAFALLSLIAGGVALAQQGSEPAAETTYAADDEGCMGCHAAEVNGGIGAVHYDALKKGPHKEATCQTCHPSIQSVPHTKEEIAEKAACKNCHSDVDEKFQKSAHANTDIVPGDHPTCTGCHSHGDPHAVVRPSEWSRADKRFCMECHGDAERMKRYKVDPDAVRSYEESFHGKALLRFGMESAAICSDCHGAHDVLSPVDPRARTHRNNASKMCSAEGCHPGSNVNFAMSGANHLRLKVKEDPVLGGINWFFRGLVLFTILGMLTMVGLDLRYKILNPHEHPRSGRPAALLISISFIFLLSTLGLATFEVFALAAWTFLLAVSMLMLSYLVYLVTPKPHRPAPSGKKYQRFSVKQRIQHALLAMSFFVLVLTGMPQRFYQLEWLQGVYSVIGGFENARLVHRSAAVVLIAVFVWHLLDLFVMWKRAGFKWKAWTMIPNKKDAQDLAQMMKVYTGKSHEEPKFDRWAFKQKMDYLAEYWGVPIMVLTGILLWFPLYWGNMLPEIALSTAIVAHGWEATLAFLAIITWHIYNEFLNPDVFPTSKLWLTGTLTREEMLKEHPLELERLEAGEFADADVPPSPEPKSDVPKQETEGPDEKK